jgi:MFS family permease
VEQPQTFTGMKAFLLIWFGQIFSLIGSSITTFALGIWAWQKTGQASPLAMVGFFFMVPMMVMTPFAGVWVDRWNRKFVMAISDLLTGLGTAIMFSAGILGVTGGIFGWMDPLIRNAETLLPDHDAAEAEAVKLESAG